MKIKHTNGCVTVEYDNEVDAQHPWHIEIRSQLPASEPHQVLILSSNELALLHLIDALKKVREAKAVLEAKGS